MSLTEVKLQGADLDDGETHRGSCPNCERRNTFTITRTGASLVYNCYSANCDFRGVVGERSSKPRRANSLVGELGNLTHSRFGETPSRVKPFTGELRELDDKQKRFLEGKIGFTDEHLSKSGVLYSATEDRFVYPIYGPQGKRRGWLLRSYDPGIDVRWKALTRLEVDEPHLSWYGPWTTDSVLVVEDIPSAVRASFHMGPVVSMCGGGTSKEAAYELKSLCRNVIWAFDQDASDLAIKHHQKYKINFNTSKVLLLDVDLKDMPEDDLRALLVENNKNNEREKGTSSSPKVEESL